VTAILTGPAAALQASVDEAGHRGLSEASALEAARDLP
jgi:hypothetical protein